MTSTFEIVAEPTRRRILDDMRDSERSVGELVERLRLSQPGVSKHLRVLREAGLVEVRRDAQRRLYRVRTEPLEVTSLFAALGLGLLVVGGALSLAWSGRLP